eukprot:12555726-Alexandrium_andersonii.AAC.1
MFLDWKHNARWRPRVNVCGTSALERAASSARQRIAALLRSDEQQAAPVPYYTCTLHGHRQWRGKH